MILNKKSINLQDKLYLYHQVRKKNMIQNNLKATNKKINKLNLNFAFINIKMKRNKKFKNIFKLIKKKMEQ